MDGKDILAGTIFFLAALFIVFVAGYGTASTAWVNDCNKLGAHLAGDQAYLCSKKP